MKSFALMLFCAMLSAAALLHSFLVEQRDTPVAVAALSPQKCVLVIDPGHGGEDGGAVSKSGVAESGLNLDLALKLEQFLAFYGHQPLLVRREDVSLHGEGADTLREKKTSDLHQRAELVNGTENAVLVSIHQNSFPQTQYHGAQVFYAPTDTSQELARAVQNALRDGLDPENKRQAKLIPDTIYLMNHVACPAILVECGFLSNPEEAARLSTPLYQKQFAATLALALHNSMSS